MNDKNHFLLQIRKRADKVSKNGRINLQFKVFIQT